MFRLGLCGQLTPAALYFMNANRVHSMGILGRSLTRLELTTIWNFCCTVQVSEQHLETHMFKQS